MKAIENPGHSGFQAKTTRASLCFLPVSAPRLVAGAAVIAVAILAGVGRVEAHDVADVFDEGVGVALVHVVGAVGARPAGSAGAEEGVDAVGATSAVGAGVGRTVVDVGAAVNTVET